MKKLLTLLALLSSGMINFSCDKEEVCSAIYLADLICSELAIAVPTVETGAAFALTTIVKNVAESTDYCKTETAGNSNTGYGVEYRADEDSPWEPTPIVDPNGSLEFEVYVPTSTLPPDETTGFEPGFRMNEPGQYRFGSNADGLIQVNERDETNNRNTSNNGSLEKAATTQTAKYVVVTVVPSADYIPPAKGEKPGSAKVEYLGYKKLW